MIKTGFVIIIVLVAIVATSITTRNIIISNNSLDKDAFTDSLVTYVYNVRESSLTIGFDEGFKSGFHAGVLFTISHFRRGLSIDSVLIRFNETYRNLDSSLIIWRQKK